MNSQRGKQIVAAVALIVVVLLLLLWGYLLRPSEPVYVPPKAQNPDTVRVEPAKQTSDSSLSKPRRRPQARDFLDENIQSE